MFKYLCVPFDLKIILVTVYLSVTGAQIWAKSCPAAVDQSRDTELVIDRPKSLKNPWENGQQVMAVFAQLKKLKSHVKVKDGRRIPQGEYYLYELAEQARDSEYRIPKDWATKIKKWSKKHGDPEVSLLSEDGTMPRVVRNVIRASVFGEGPDMRLFLRAHVEPHED